MSRTARAVGVALAALLAALSLTLVTSAMANENGNGNESANGNGNGNAKAQGNGQSKVTVCHATGSATNPYVEITIAQAGWDNGHAKHAGDSLGACPDDTEPPPPPPPVDDGGVGGTTTTKPGDVAGTTTTGQAGELPFTGLETNLIALLAAVLVGIGGALQLVRPRRKAAAARTNGRGR